MSYQSSSPPNIPSPTYSDELRHENPELICFLHQLRKSLDDAFFSNSICDIQTRIHDLWESMSTKGDQSVTPDSIKIEDFFSDENSFDTMSSASNDLVSREVQTDLPNESIDISSASSISNESYSTIAVNRQNSTSERPSKQDTTTLFVSRLKRTVQSSDIRQNFPGCVKVTMKHARDDRSMKYAFVKHRSSQAAARNLTRQLDINIFGPDYCIAYVNPPKTRFRAGIILDKKKLMIRRIPLGFVSDDVKNLFNCCEVVTYSSATTVRCGTLNPETNAYRKIIPGFACIRFDKEEDAEYVVEHADQYRLNDRQLFIEFYQI
ncbi:unnamed protein product [Adineta ricciae]|uniref:RRM domain-containing protein n=1 Tax=Adineta ricciae TaxID=249248 RepID=A0A814I7R6_ADIRI|nr:unnamed protein product [Adineta ricciae]